MPDPTRVFVVYGRNNDAYDAIVLFLRALRLDPVSFYEIRNELGGSPFVGNIVRTGMERAQAVVALLTPDEEAFLHSAFQAEQDAATDANRWQPRPNVLLEVGMALAIDERRTIMVSVGKVALPSDLHGRHFVRLDNSLPARELLKGALEGAGCAVKQAPGWHDPRIAGDFESCVPNLTPAQHGDNPDGDALALDRMLAALRQSTHDWLNLKTLATKGQVAIETALALLKTHPSIEFGRNPKRETVVRLSSKGVSSAPKLAEKSKRATAMTNDTAKIEPAKAAKRKPAPLDRLGRAAGNVSSYLETIGYKAASFGRIRARIGPQYTDSVLLELIRKWPQIFRRARFVGGKTGIGLAGVGLRRRD